MKINNLLFIYTLGGIGVISSCLMLNISYLCKLNNINFSYVGLFAFLFNILLAQFFIQVSSKAFWESL